VLPCFVGHPIDDQDSERFCIDNSDAARVAGAPVFFFQYCLNGYGMFRAHRREYRIELGQGFLFRLPSNTAHWLPEGACWERLFVAFRGATATSIAERLLEWHGPIFTLPIDSEAVCLLGTLCEEAMTDEKPSIFRAASVLYRFLMVLGEIATSANCNSPHAIRTSLNFINNRYSDPNLQLDDLARQAGLSKHYFAHLFRRVTGQTPGIWLRDRRMRAAQELLSYTHLPTKRIAHFVGYRDYNYFCRVYRRWSGKTPGQIRQGN